MRYILGVDEAGRGPLAGPVAVGLVVVSGGLDVASEFPGVRDSKQLSEKRRETLFDLLVARAELGDVHYRVELESAEAIDREGIAVVIRRALARGLDTLAPDSRWVKVLLDGGLRAPVEYAQETVVRGDETIPLISLASIAAKVTRDRVMKELACEYPAYGFEKHKGYGTRAHYAALREHGLSAIHRRSYIHLDKSEK